MDGSVLSDILILVEFTIFKLSSLLEIHSISIYEKTEVIHQTADKAIKVQADSLEKLVPRDTGRHCKIQLDETGMIGEIRMI